MTRAKLAELAVLELARRGFMVRYEDGLYRWTAKREDPRHDKERLGIIDEYLSQADD